MKPVVIAMAGNERLTDELAAHLGLERGVATVRRFPDGESHVRVETSVDARHAFQSHRAGTGHRRLCKEASTMNPNPINQESVMSFIRSKLAVLFTLALLALVPSITLAQARLEREGVVLYWGLVPAAVVSEKHAMEDMHGVVPKDGGQVHHLVVALFNSKGTRIEDAVVRAQLSESGIVDAPPKYLTPMNMNGQATYGQLFSTARSGPYRFRVFVKLPSRATEIEFAVSAWSPHREVR